MSWAGTEVQQLYLAKDRCGVLDRTGTCHWYEGSDLPALLEQGLGAVARRPGRLFPRRASAVQVWLSGALIRPFLMGPVTGIKGQREAISLAQAQVAEATGFAMPCEVRLDGSVERETAVVTAIPAQTRLQIEQTVRRAGFRLKALRPWWAGVIEQALAEQADLELLAVEDTESLVVMTASGDLWTAADTHTPAPGAEQTHNMIRRLAMGSAIEPIRVARYNLGAEAAAISRLWPAPQLVSGGGES